MANQCCKFCSLNNHFVYFLIIIAVVFANNPDEHLESVPSNSRTPENIPIVVPSGNLPDRHDTSGGHIEEVQPDKIAEEIAPQGDINVLVPVSTSKTTNIIITTIPTSTTNNENRTEHRTTTVSANQGNDIASISFGNRHNNDTTNTSQEPSFNVSLDNVTSATEFDSTSTYSPDLSEAGSAETSNANIDQTTLESENVDHQITSTLDGFEEATTTGSEGSINWTVSTTGPIESIHNSTLEDSYSQYQVTVTQTTPSNDLTSTKPTSSTPITSLNFGDGITEPRAAPNYATSQTPLKVPVNITYNHMSNATTVSFNEEHGATVGTSKAVASMSVGNEQSLELAQSVDGLKCNDCGGDENNKQSSGQSTQTQHGNNIQDIDKYVTSGVVPSTNHTVKENTVTRKPSELNNRSTERPRTDTTESRSKWEQKKTEVPPGGSTDRWPNQSINGHKTQDDFKLSKAPSTYMSMMLHCTWSYFCLHWLAFQRALASKLTSTARIDTNTTQIVFFNCDVCRHPWDEAMSVASWTGPIDVPFYVTDKTGQYSKALTELLAFILMKSNPSDNFSSVIISIRLHRQEEDAAFSTGLEGNPSAGVVAAIAISCIAGICLIFVCILLLILKKRHERQLKNQRCRKVSDGYSLDSISIYSSFTRRRKASKRSFLNHAFDDPTCPSNKVNFAGLANISQDPEALVEEFKQIPVIHPRYEDLPPGAELKNRYANIIPVPETRVPLTAKSGDTCSDYINANFIRGLGDDSKKYIACQAPLPNTIGDFWKMIWEQQSKVIIMLTQFDEEHVPKCAQYFPRSSTVDFHHLHGDFQITNKKVDSRADYTITTLQIKNLERNLVRDVIHLWFTAWTSRDVHPDADSVLHFLLEANSYIASNPGPTIVHCSNGTGRTGAILAIHICMREFIYARMVDIPKCVYRIRQDRCGAVQTKEQYALIYEVLSEYATRVMNNSIVSSRRSSNRSLSARSSRN